MARQRLVRNSLVLATLLGMATASIPARADVEAGITAFLSGNRIVAWRELLPAAKKGNAEAQYYVGTMYRHGFGTEQDDTEARFWLTRAAEQSHHEAQFVLGFDLLQRGRHTEGSKYILAAAENGYGAAQYYAGLLYRDGAGVTRDAGRALDWFLRAAEQDVVDAQYEAGWMLADSQSGVPTDLPAAYRWFFIAAAADFPAAARSRDQAVVALSADQLGAAQQAARQWIAAHR